MRIVRPLTMTAREAAAAAGQQALAAGAGATVQLALLSIAATRRPPTLAPCNHAGDRQVQLSFDRVAVVRCCACGEIAASLWPRP